MGSVCALSGECPSRRHCPSRPDYHPLPFPPSVGPVPQPDASVGKARPTKGASSTLPTTTDAALVIRFAVGQCSLGAILVASSHGGLCSILLGGDAARMVRDLQDRFPQAEVVGDDQFFERLVANVVGLVDDPRRGLSIPLDVRGTAFQQRVWLALQKLPEQARDLPRSAHLRLCTHQPTPARSTCY